MLQTCINQNLFLYAMIAAGIVGVWCLFWSNRFYARAIRDLSRMDKPKSKWTSKVMENKRARVALNNTGAFLRSQMISSRSAGISLLSLRQGSLNAALVIFGLTAVSLWILYSYQYEWNLRIQYGVIGGGMACALLLIRVCQDYSGKEEILLDGWTDYLENCVPDRAVQKEKSVQQELRLAEEVKNKVPDRTEPVPDGGEEERIAQVREGIRQSAAANSRFAGMMSPEEEKIMREVIREYLT
ncbi:MAG: hypothetical protein ACI4EG_04540 [Fusicatenibacter sp.]|nr:hypothetical protein [Fusicatenibacter sp.]